MNFNVRLNFSLIVCLSLAGIDPANVVQGRPNYAVNSGNNCSACHQSTVTGRMEITGEDSLTDLVTQLDGQVRGPLKTFKAVPGQVVTLSIRVMDGSDRFAIQIKGFEEPAQRHGNTHLLTWSSANSQDNSWTRQQKTNPPYFTKDNGANGGLSGLPGPMTYRFDLLVEPETPLDIYELVAAVPGVKNGVKVYQEERFYLEVLSPYDLNGDAKVDCSDICILVGQWHQDDPRCDFSPIPGGDGLVDAQDLVVLSDHLFEDHRLLAHWMLDDTEGSVTFDRIDHQLGAVMGIPTWQPDSGQVNGALLLTGDGNYLRVPFVSNLAIRPFSLFVWVKGGQAGQVILSQEHATNWLMADPQTGTLMTELAGLGQAQEPLVSEFVIADKTWHHVGLVWDGTQRILYADTLEVARDDTAQPDSSGGFNVGAGLTLASNSFWTGLIDDIRIYDRAIAPQKGSSPCE